MKRPTRSKKTEAAFRGIAGKDDHGDLRLDGCWRMLVLDDDDLAILLMVSDEVLVEALFEVGASQCESFVSLRLEVRQQGEIEHYKARMRQRVLLAEFEEIRGNQMKFVGAHNNLVDGFACAYRYQLSDDVIDLIMPYCETFIDVDGEESLRITEAGVAATARPGRVR